VGEKHISDVLVCYSDVLIGGTHEMYSLTIEVSSLSAVIGNTRNVLSFSMLLVDYRLAPVEWYITLLLTE